MDIKQIDLKGKILDFNFNKEGFIVRYNDAGVIKQYGSSGKEEMIEFAKILVKELATVCVNEGIVKKTDG